MLIDTLQSDARTIYQTLIGVVTPRPIAWVTTVNAEGRVNLAPFSFFNAFGGSPPLVIFAPNRKRDGSKKDTLRNVEANGEFVINLAVEDLAEAMNLSSKELPPDESEIELTGLTTTPSIQVKPPRIAASPVHLECVVQQILTIGEGVTSANLVMGKVALVHVADGILDARGHVDPRKLKALGRLGSDYYCRTTDVLEMRRP
jgi:flavin reductase (DIM6/NTAB) family NADH-FMN oxidoreductase RutF